MKCYICGEEIQGDNYVIGRDRHSGNEIAYCHEECYKEKFGESIGKTEKRHAIIDFVFLVVGFLLYYCQENIYLSMLFYFFFCGYIAKVYLDSKNDIFMLIAAVLLPILPNGFSLSYRLFLFGTLLSAFLGYIAPEDLSGPYDSRWKTKWLRLKLGATITFIGGVIALAGIAISVYNFFFS